MFERYKNLSVWITVFVLSFFLYGQALLQPSFGFDALDTSFLNLRRPNSIIQLSGLLELLGTWLPFFRVFLYSSICGLVFSLITTLTTKRWLLAVFTTFLFAAHPVHSEVVASSFYTEELLSLFLALLSWITMLKWVKTQSIQWLLLSVCFYFLAVLFLPEIAPLALLVPLSLWFKDIGTRKYQLASFFALISTTTLALLLQQTHILPGQFPSYLSHSEHWSLGQVVVTIGQYIKLSVWPQPLSFVYGYNAVPFNGWLATNTVVAITLIISLVTTALVFSSKKRLIGLGSLIFIVAILPVSNVLYPLEAQIVERGLLIPSIGMCLVMATLLVWLVKKVNLYIGGVIFILVFGGFSTLSFNRIAQWADYETLIQADVSNYPNSAPLQRLNGEFYFLQIPNYDGDERHLLAKKSIRHLIAASKLKSEWAKAHLQLGVLYDREINQPFEALPHFERCLKLKPKSFISAFNIAGCYSQMGMQDSAVYFIKKTLDINPAHYESLEFLTSHYFRRDKIQLGFGFANRFIQMYPQADVPHLIFADYYFKQENESIAVQQLEIASQKNPVNKETLKALFDYYYAKKDFDKAEQYRDIAVYN